MIRNDKTVIVERSGDFAESTFGIDTDDVSLILEIIRNKLYTNKIGSFVREITSNAYDAMVEAAINQGESVESVKNKTIDFTLPNEDNNNTFTIRDYGTGMSEEKVKKIYTRVGKSTRSNSNKFVGMMGIGRLVGFCLTDSFNVTSFVDGVRTEYLCYIDETKCGKVAMLSQAETKEPNGIAISVNVAPEFHNELANEIGSFTSFIEEVKFKFLQMDRGYTFRHIDKSEELKNIDYKGNNWVKYRGRVGGPSAFVKMGLVKYPLPDSLVSGEFFVTGTTIFNVSIGDVTVSASREGLELTPETKSFVIKLINEAKSECAKVLMSSIDKAKNVAEAVDAFEKHSTVWRSLDQPAVFYVNPENKRKLDIAELSDRAYDVCTYRLSMVDDKDDKGLTKLDTKGFAIQVPELDTAGNPIIYEQKHNLGRYEVREYKIENSRRIKVDRSFSFDFSALKNCYYRIVDDHDVESLPDIRRCRTLFRLHITHRVYVFTKRGLSHFIHHVGFNPTAYMTDFETIVETILPRGTATRPPVSIKKIVFMYDTTTNEIKVDSNTSTVDLDNLAPGYWVSRHYSSILYNRSTVQAIDEHELLLLFKSVTGFLKHNTTLYILPASCGRILDTLRKEGSDEYADLVPVYAWVDLLFKNTKILEHLCCSTTDIDVHTSDLREVVKIFKKDYKFKSPTTFEIMELIKKALRPHIPGEVKVPNQVVDKLRSLHNTGDGLKVQNFSELLNTKIREVNHKFPLMPDDMSNLRDINEFVRLLPVYDEYVHAVEFARTGFTQMPVPQQTG